MSMKYKVQLPIKHIEKYSWSSGSKILIPDFPPDAEIEKYKQWCKEKIGTNKWNYYGKYRKVPCEFRFKDPADATAFKLTFIL
jgi:hypothetical protein